MLARITVDGGGSVWTSNKLLQSGVFETDDPLIIADAVKLSRQLDWVTVEQLDDRLPSAVGLTSEPSLVQTIDGSLGDQSGAMTLGDVKKPVVSCGLCADKEFKTQAGLVAHRRSLHPELDASTGEPKVTPQVAVVEGQPNELKDGGTPAPVVVTEGVADPPSPPATVIEPQPNASVPGPAEVPQA